MTPIVILLIVLQLKWDNLVRSLSHRCHVKTVFVSVNTVYVKNVKYLYCSTQHRERNNFFGYIVLPVFLSCLVLAVTSQ